MQHAEGMADARAYAPAVERATVQQVHDLALSMPGVTVESAGKNPVYQVSRRASSSSATRGPTPSTPRPASGTTTSSSSGSAEETDKQALVEDDSTPFFTTPHFDGHPSVLLRGSRIGELTATSWPRSCTTRGWRARASGRGRSGWPSAASTR